MGKQYLDLPSWQKTQVSDSILDQIIKNREFHLTELQKFAKEKNPKLVLMPCTGSGFLTAVPDENKEEVILLWNIYKKADDDLQLIKWYINKLLLSAVNVKVIQECIPDYYWKFLRRLNLTGIAYTDELYRQDCYDILEQAQINNLLLGIHN